MASWDIKKDVEKWTASARLNSKNLSVRAESVLQHDGCLDHEHFLCGDEQSVCGRYGQNALGPVSAVAIQNSIMYRFGDYKVCHESKRNKTDIPDFVGVYCPAKNLEELQDLPKGEKPAMVLVGEAKTPWKHDLYAAWNQYKTNANNDEEIRHAFGQIASYMHRFNMRYGFLTTYNHTIFLCQGLYEGHSILYFTKPIRNSETPTKDNKDAISVRQYFYYILVQISDSEDQKGYTAKNTFRLDEWVGLKTSLLPNRSRLTTPLTQRSQPNFTTFVSTPTGLVGMADDAPLKLYMNRVRNMYEATISFKPGQIQQQTGRKVVKINGKPVVVTLDDDGDDDDASSGSGRDVGDYGGTRYDNPQQKDQRLGQRMVSFREPHEDKSSRGKGSLFDTFQRAKEPSRPTEQIGVEARDSRSQRDRQTLLSPEQGRPGSQRRDPRSPSPTNPERESYQHRRAGFPDLSQSPSPLPMSSPTPRAGQGRSYPGTLHPQPGAPRLPAAPAAEHVSRGMPHRPRDTEREESGRHEKPEEGRKLRSSNKSSEQPPPKRSGHDNDKNPPSAGHSIFGRSWKKR